MGKWSSLKTALPRQIGHEPPDDEDSSSWNDDVEKLKAAFEADPKLTTQAALAEAYAAARDFKNARAREQSEAAKAVEALERMLVRRLEDAGMSGIALADGSKFDLDDKPVAKVTDPDAFLAFVKANGMEHLLTIHANTRKAIATERYANGVTETPGIALTIRTTIARRKKK